MSARILDRMAIDRARLVDLAIAAFVVVMGVAELVEGLIEPAWLWALVIGVTGALTFAVRRGHPLLLIAWLVALQATLQGGADAEPAFYFLLGLVAAFSVAAHATLRTGLVGVGVIIASYAIYSARAEVPAEAWEVVFGSLFLAFAFGFGFGFGRARRRGDRLQTRAAGLLADREAEARAAVADEQARIARELHDAVAHDVSVITLQLGAVRRRLGPDQAREVEVLRRLERSGREAVDELRRIVGILREDGVNGDRSPRPTMSQLEALVEQVRDAGTPVDLDLGGEPVQLSPGIDASAYRIIQEALANVIRHAPGARASVAVNYTPYDLRIDVTDDGPGPPATKEAAVGPGGHGLVGMRERVNLFGGEIQTGADPAGGYGVHVRLPLPTVRE